MSHSGLTINNVTNSGGMAYPPQLRPVVNVSAATTLTPSQSGALISITSAAANYTITLPAVATSVGVEYTFVLTASAGTNTVAITAPAGTLCGFLPATYRSDTNAITYTQAAVGGGSTTATLATTVVPGYSFSLYCNGAYWIIRSATLNGTNGAATAQCTVT